MLSNSSLVGTVLNFTVQTTPSVASTAPNKKTNRRMQAALPKVRKPVAVIFIASFVQ
ncbi:MAG: hypothetical protein AABO41_08160 [Acidobacteriota bacterium]